MNTSLRYVVYFLYNESQVFYDLKGLYDYMEELDYDDRMQVKNVEILHYETEIPLDAF